MKTSGTNNERRFSVLMTDQNVKHSDICEQDYIIALKILNLAMLSRGRQNVANLLLISLVF